MNIAFFSLVPFAPYVGGLEAVTLGMAQSLARAGHRVICLSSHPEQREMENCGGVELRRIGKLQPGPLTEMLRQGRVDVLWLNSFSVQELPLCRASCDAAGCKLIAQMHGDPRSELVSYRDCLALALHEAKHGRSVGRFVYDILRYPLGYGKRFVHERRKFRRLIEKADALCLLSPGFIPVLSRMVGGGVDTSKLHALSNPLTMEMPAEEEPADKADELLYVGRLPWQHKRVDRLLRAWKLLEKDFPGWRLRIVGDGHAKAQYEELSRDLNLRQVQFCGAQQPQPYYRRARICCLTSSCEGFALVLNESMAYGCVPVAFDSYAAVRDIITDGENGCLVRPFDISAYAETLRRLMSHPEQIAQMAQRARRSVRRFVPEAVASQYVRLLESL